jgi:hypothetical protein
MLLTSIGNHCYSPTLTRPLSTIATFITVDGTLAGRCCPPLLPVTPPATLTRRPTVVTVINTPFSVVNINPVVVLYQPMSPPKAKGPGSTSKQQKTECQTRSAPVNIATTKILPKGTTRIRNDNKQNNDAHAKDNKGKGNPKDDGESCFAAVNVAAEKCPKKAKKETEMRTNKTRINTP